MNEAFRERYTTLSRVLWNDIAHLNGWVTISGLNMTFKVCNCQHVIGELSFTYKIKD